MENQICMHATNTNFVLVMNMVAVSRMYLKSCLRQVGDPGLAGSIKYVFKNVAQNMYHVEHYPRIKII